MFRLSQEQRGMSVEEKDKIFSLFSSINEPKIAALDRPAEPTQAFICSVGLADDQVMMRIVLYLLQSKIRVVYNWDETITKKQQGGVEEEALDFVENMGFMMDNMNLAKFSPEQKIEVLDGLPIFDAGQEEAIAEASEIEESEDSLSALEAEFERDDGAFESEFDNAMDSILPEGEAPSQPKPEASTAMRSEVKGALRLLSSF